MGILDILVKTLIKEDQAEQVKVAPQAQVKKSVKKPHGIMDMEVGNVAHPVPSQKNMDKKEAIGKLSNGHAFWYVSTAEEICKALGLTLPKGLIEHYKGQKDANPTNHPKGLWLNEDKPCSGVSGLPLSDWVIGQFNLDVESYGGRGFQAQANSEALGKHFKIK
jgi:hypothetical protein